MFIAVNLYESHVSIKVESNTSSTPLPTLVGYLFIIERSEEVVLNPLLGYINDKVGSQVKCSY